MAHEVLEETLATARGKLSSGDTRGAIDDLLEAVMQEPDAASLWSLLGIAQWRVGAVRDSIDSLETALTLAPLGPEARMALALGYEVIQKPDLARGLLTALAEEEGLPLGLLESLARALGRAHEPALAMRVCQQAAMRQPEEVSPLLGVAFYMAKLGCEPEQILPVLFRAFHLDPEDFNTRMLLARRLHQCGRTREAAYLLSVVEIESSNCASCLNAMREIFLEAGDESSAQRCLDTLLTVAQRGDCPNDQPLE